MSDTPRTDKHLHNPVVYNGDDGPYAAMDTADYGEWVPSWLSGDLEREIAGLKARLQETQEVQDAAIMAIRIEWKAAIAQASDFRVALERLAAFDGESIWSDERDDAANSMLRIAQEALENKQPA